MKTTVRMQAPNALLELPQNKVPKQAEEIVILGFPQLDFLELQDRDYPDDDVLGVPSCCFDY